MYQITDKIEVCKTGAEPRLYNQSSLLIAYRPNIVIYFSLYQ
jgi:hypothetical protein